MARKSGCYCFEKAQLEVCGDREIVKFARELPPAHYTIKIESFSLLSEIVRQSKHDKYECREFSAGGHKWSLCIYPEGNEKEDGKGHISLYLKLVDKLGACHVVEMSLKFFIFDQIRFKYLTFSDIRDKRFHAMKNEWGFPLLPRSEFNDVSNGFLIDDSCIFGVEAFAVGKTAHENGGKCVLSVVKEPELLLELTKVGAYIWKIPNFSETKTKTKECSPVFTIEGHDWKLLLYPLGNAGQRGKNLSIFLRLHNPYEFTRGRKLATEFEICFKNKFQGKDMKKTTAIGFCTSIPDWGFLEFLPIKEFNDPSAGFIVDDLVTIKVTIRAIFPVQN